ncbi:MAG TPA: hypothetical protein VES42_28675, partial [Pilimelia sp.]|nr:hypothetical protein [Pilimelia sp.]
MRWATARRGAVLAGAVLVGLCLVAPAPASAARGVEVRIVDAPAELAAGDSPRPLVVEATRPGRSECLKVRWSLVLRLSGITLDQVQVVRVEEDGAFAVDLVADGDTARLTDIEFDPGTLCDDQTVTARYEVSVAGDVPAGELAVTAEAYD